VLLLAANGFFVAAEFALVAAKRHRLETAAAEGSRGARAAMAGTRQLSMMLAGAQLGITLCTLGLGALAKPTVAHLLEPVFTVVGLPAGAAYVVAFILAVALVGFLHVVVGEMAPKSWAISHPETSAQLLAIPFVGFTTVFRPVLVALNGLANACLRLFKVTPQDELAQVHNAEQLQMLLKTSKEHGTIEDAEHELLTAMLRVQSMTVREVMVPTARILDIPAPGHRPDRDDCRCRSRPRRCESNQRPAARDGSGSDDSGVAAAGRHQCPGRHRGDAQPAQPSGSGR
jgi:CBS domain containing-hemolysin-like protein